MKLPLNIAIKLREMITTNEWMNSSALKHAVVNRMIQEGVLIKRQLSNTKSKLGIRDVNELNAYLRNQFGIADLNNYIEVFDLDEISRADLVRVGGDSKLKQVRTFEGFMVNTIQPIKATLNGQDIEVNPKDGSLLFINSYESFTIDQDVLVVGIENAENFIQLRKQAYLFDNINALFVCRYPQNNDLIKWLLQISNRYLHFGDFDIAGIKIYINEFRKHLDDRATFFLPAQIESLLQEHGNRDLYNRQWNSTDDIFLEDEEESIRNLYRMIRQSKKVLEQEVLIGSERI